MRIKNVPSRINLSDLLRPFSGAVSILRGQVRRNTVGHTNALPSNHMNIGHNSISGYELLAS
ncbi:MAG: hypothetical protein KGZ92_10935 [Firmicutes bacterium]|nr:hypothetical protein [Dethiobacter sp.]MBS3889783.1 hypothetical protein [Bacillota bacterium]